ncbi:MAG: SBBP repeat-containing protein [Ignavibacteria bacterium]|nr:SBBP repeat-containing protein [Ignavibacteria bacterium]
MNAQHFRSTGSQLITGEDMKKSFSICTRICILLLSIAMTSLAGETRSRAHALEMFSNKIPKKILDKVAQRPTAHSKRQRTVSAAVENSVESQFGTQSHGNPQPRFAEGSPDTIVPAWSQQYTAGLAPAEDAATASTLGAGGYIYVTGYSTDANTGTDYFTVKYDSTGARLWTARYDNPQHGDDIAQAIAVDDSGNVYVTGKSNGFGTAWDIVTVKYDTLGSQLWTARYNGSVNGDDAGIAIAIDASQNIYVAGNSASQSSYSEGDSYNDDIVVIKYNSAGTEQWNVRKNGAGNATDQVAAMALDGSGNVFIAGSTENLGSYNYYVLKYTSGGSLSASDVYDGPASADDRATDIKVDASGNVYVTGSSVGSGTYEDYLTIKYNGSLGRTWTARYNGTGGLADGAVGLALDASSNVYVTGWSYGTGTSADIATVKYSSGGIEQWVARYDGTGSDLDIATAITVSQNNVYVTGWSYGGTSADDFVTIKYNSAGTEQWVARLDGSGNAGDYPSSLSVDASGNAYVVGFSDGGSTGNDFDVVKYNTSGAKQWNDRYNGPGNTFERATALATDNSGNIYVAGQSDGLLTAADFVTIKYDASGNQLWTARYNGAGNTYDYATAIVIDNSGDVYVTGYSDADYLTVKYDALGAQQWAARYNGPGNSTDFATAIAVNGSGVYVTGRSYGSGSSYDYATIKYNAATGNALWIARYDGPGNADDYASAIALDNSGNIYVTGTSGIYPDNDFATVKYNSGGTEQWVSRYNGPGNSDDQSVAIGVQTSGKVIVAGSSFGSAGSYDFATIAYNSSDGGFAWLDRYDGAGNSADFVSAMKIGSDDNIVIVGSSGTSSALNYATVKLDASGSRKWSAEYNGSSNDADAANAVAINNAGEVFVTGYSYRTRALSDIVTVKYSPNGIQQWATRYDSPSNNSDVGSAIIIDASDNLIVAGQSFGVGSSSITTIKYTTSANTLALATGWNMVSIPRIVSDFRKTVLFPSAASSAFAYAHSTYELRDTLQNGVGYWLNFSTDQTIAIAGQEKTFDTVQVALGWNMIGTITDAIPIASIASIPGGITTSNFFGYNGSYYIADTLKPGKGYWIQTSSAGKLVLSSSAVPQANRIRIVPGSELPPPPPDGEMSSNHPIISSEFALHQNYPNPFNPATNFGFSILDFGMVRLAVYDVLGREVAVIVNEELPAGNYTRMWDASTFASGLYMYRLQTKNFTQTKEMLLIK